MNQHTWKRRPRTSEVDALGKRRNIESDTWDCEVCKASVIAPEYPTEVDVAFEKISENCSPTED